jgi:hypothetical protein
MLEGKRPLVRPRRRWRIILKVILKKYYIREWSAFIWYRLQTGGGLL